MSSGAFLFRLIKIKLQCDWLEQEFPRKSRRARRTKGYNGFDLGARELYTTKLRDPMHSFDAERMRETSAMSTCCLDGRARRSSLAVLSTCATDAVAIFTRSDFQFSLPLSSEHLSCHLPIRRNGCVSEQVSFAKGWIF